jgi:4-carboxymuconolactone decarboxylase
MMNEIQSEGLNIFRDLIPDVLPDDQTSLRDGEFGSELTELALDHVFAAFWGRPGLDRRSRSLVTLGALIALRASDELEFHIPMALRNGLTIEELEEVVYHSASYAGYPAAVSARGIARKVLGSQADQPKPQG